MIKIKRVYDPADKHDGFRILVDRLWPRGLTKEKSKIDLWLKEIAPSNTLRKWSHHDPKRWTEFKKRYFAELAGHTEHLKIILSESSDKTVTLLFAAKDEQHNNAVALREYLEKLSR
jgi:uncharacterized protein YeaO (DUF488 family)